MGKHNIYSFFGIDGAGKTTTIQHVAKELKKQGIESVIMRMNRAGDHKLPLIKPFMKLKAAYLRRRVKDAKKTNPQNRDDVLVDVFRERGLLFMIIYYLDLWLRYLEAKRTAKKRVVLMDRYFYDGLTLTKKRYLKLFRKLTPKVKSFFLVAPPNVILSRKQEANMKNIKDYRNRIETHVKKHFPITTIDTSQPLKKVVKNILQEMKR